MRSYVLGDEKWGGIFPSSNRLVPSTLSLHFQNCADIHLNYVVMCNAG